MLIAQKLPFYSKNSQKLFYWRSLWRINIKKMMKEILRNEVVNGELQVHAVFYFYRKGILQSRILIKQNNSYLSYENGSQVENNSRKIDERRNSSQSIRVELINIYMNKSSLNLTGGKRKNSGLAISKK
jgi:hypothetical protein